MLEEIAPYLIGLVIAQEIVVFVLRKAYKRQDELFKQLHEIAERRMDLLEKSVRQREDAQDRALFYVEFSKRMITDIQDSFDVVLTQRSAFIQHRFKMRNEELSNYKKEKNVI